MFCGNCGKEIPVGATFCAECGLPVPETGEVPVVEQPKSKSFKAIGIVAALVAVAVVVWVAFGLFGGGAGNYEDVACKYAVAEVEYNYNEAADYIAFDIMLLLEDVMEYACESAEMTMDEVYEELSEEFDFNVNSMDDILKCVNINQKESLQEEFGDYEINVEVIDSCEVDKSEWEDELSDLDDIPFDIDKYIDLDKIKEAYEVEVEVEIVGTEDSELIEKTYLMALYNGKWKVLSADMSGLM